MKVLSLFDYSNTIRDEFRSRGVEAYSLDIAPGHKNNKVDICTDILCFNYQTYSPDDFSFLFIALPCQCYSTDLFLNFDALILVNPIHRVNGLYGKTKLDNMSYRSRVTYPKSFAAYIVDVYLNYKRS